METVASNVYVYRYNCPSPSNCQPFEYIANPGRYLLECWGAQGGNVTSPFLEGGKGGYASGYLTLTEQKKLYIFPGEKGSEEYRITYGQGGFGRNAAGFTSGGGMSMISLDYATNESGILFAAGGGGSLYSSDYGGLHAGGYGGGEKGGDGEFDSNNPSERAFGATQSSGGTTKEPQNNGGKYYGGSDKSGGSASGGGGGYYGGASGYSSGAAGSGGSSFIDSKLTDPQNIPGNKPMPSQYSLTAKDTGNRGHGAVRITILGYVLFLRNPPQDRYNSGATVSIDLSLSTLGVGDRANISRRFGSMPSGFLLSHDDDGIVYEFSDTFRVPSIPMILPITYTVTNKLGTSSELTFKITVNKPPKIQPLGEMKDSYNVKEQSYIDITLIDDSFSILIMRDENEEYFSQKVYCRNNATNTTRVFFTIPNYEVGSKHNVSIFAIDEFNAPSNTLSFSYEVIKNKTPDIILMGNISYLYPTNSYISINASIRDFDPNSRVCLSTTIDNSMFLLHECKNLTDNKWSTFLGRIYLSGTSYDIHTLRIYAIDDQSGESNKILRQFSYFDPQICHRFVSVLAVNRFERCINWLLLIYIDMTC